MALGYSSGCMTIRHFHYQPFKPFWNGLFLDLVRQNPEKTNNFSFVTIRLDLFGCLIDKNSAYTLGKGRKK